MGRLGDAITLKVKASPEKGRPKKAVVALQADRLVLAPSSIAVVSCLGSPATVVAINGMEHEGSRQAFSR